jgi:hypothetical protein
VTLIVGPAATATAANASVRRAERARILRTTTQVCLIATALAWDSCLRCRGHGSSCKC